ncbi:MAG TPA: AAA family ATPase [Acidimicrobiia bacterium]|nr:AAA family ATPase [Acidimicrobiia bacterium]
MTTDARIAETHSAWVILLGDRAYKIKKPIALDFLDFSTREAREAIAHREVELNRRLAPDVYLGVADIVGPDGEVCDHMVVMRRMPDDRRLATLVGAGALLDDELRDIARVVAAFHERAERSPEIAEAGRPDALREKVETDLAQMHDFAPAVLDPHVLDEVANLVGRYLRGRTRLLETRVATGMVRDGHGDLLAADIFCLPDGPRILDCIEFDDRIRHGDVLADLAFLMMDLERLDAPALATALLGWYREFTAETHPETLAHYYMACRALVRSKVACIRSAQGDDASRSEATQLLGLARTHLRRAQVRIVLVGGAPGTGKSTLAAGIAETARWTVLRSDEVRKDLVGIGHTTGAGADIGTGIYDAATTDATYRELLARARVAAELGESTILDASWSSSAHRTAAARLAQETSSDLVELCCTAPADVADARIRARVEEEDASDATPTVAAAIRTTFDDWPSARVIDTTPGPEVSLSAALEHVEGMR